MFLTHALRALQKSSAASYFIGTLGSGTIFNVGQAIAVDLTGNSYIAGYSNSPQVCFLAKYNSTGIIQWQRILSSSASNTFKGVGVDSSGNVYLCGQYTDLSGYTGALIAKYDTSGTLQWQKSFGYNGVNSFGFNTIKVDSSGNFYVIGNGNYSPVTATGYAFIAKYDTSGTLQWQRSLDSSSSDSGTGIGFDSSGNIYVCIASNGISGSDYYTVVAKYNSSGAIQWQKSLGSSGISNLAYGITVDSSGNSYTISAYTPNGYDLGIAKYDTSGTLQWQRAIGSTGYEGSNGIAVDSSGNVYAIGYSSTVGSNDVVIVKYDTSGTLQWQRSLGVSTKTEVGYAITVDTSGSFYITGYANNGTTANFLIGKFPTDGTKTGTYTVGSDSFVYAATSFSSITTTMTSATSSLTAATSTLSTGTTTLTSSTPTYTSTVTTL
jgi:hypothetical protein